MVPHYNAGQINLGSFQSWILPTLLLSFIMCKMYIIHQMNVNTCKKKNFTQRLNYTVYHRCERCIIFKSTALENIHVLCIHVL